jgi:hypothetical protein
VRFNSVNLFVEGLRAEVQVRLDSGAHEMLGTASGVPTRLGTERLVVEATLDALQQRLGEEVRLVAGELQIARVGSGEAVIVEVVLARRRSEQSLLGACYVGQDRQRSVVLATLDAVNRVLGGLVGSRWTEIRVEPEAAEWDGGKQG